MDHHRDGIIVQHPIKTITTAKAVDVHGVYEQLHDVDNTERAIKNTKLRAEEERQMGKLLSHEKRVKWAKEDFKKTLEEVRQRDALVTKDGLERQLRAIAEVNEAVRQEMIKDGKAYNAEDVLEEAEGDDQ